MTALLDEGSRDLDMETRQRLADRIRAAREASEAHDAYSDQKES